MARIQPLQPHQTPDRSRPLLEQVQRALGMVPNMMKTMAHSPATLSAYLQQSAALGSALDAELREKLALAVAGLNGCDYCASAHTALGKHAGISDEELAANLRGRSSDERTQAALRFALAVVQTRGRPNAADVASIRAAGYDDAALTEIVAVVALNIFTNYFNLTAETEIDFPKIETGR